jgi:tetratricopeptide (TPR) repeat protein
VGAAHTSTRALEGGRGHMSGAALAGMGTLALSSRQREADDVACDPTRHAGGSAARPWERVGGSGWEGAGAPPDARQNDESNDAYTPHALLRPDLEPGDSASAAAAEALNDAGLVEFAAKRHRAAAECFAEARRLRPDAASFAANEAAAQLARGRHARAAAAARAALALEPRHARAATRLGQACLALGEADSDAGRGDRGKAALREAKAAFATALSVEPGAPAAARGAKEAALAWAAEFDSDEE